MHLHHYYPTPQEFIIISIFPALHMVRVMGMAGHKIIVADQDPTGGYSMTRFSKYVSKYIHVNASNKDQYLDAMEKIWKQEDVDWFIPVSHIDLAIDDVKSKVLMETLARHSVRFRQFCLELISFT